MERRGTTSLPESDQKNIQRSTWLCQSLETKFKKSASLYTERSSTTAVIEPVVIIFRIVRLIKVILEQQNSL